MTTRMTGSRAIGITAAMVLALFVVVMDNSILNVALPDLSSDDRGLGADVNELQWIVNAYVLSFAAFIFAWTTIASRIGERRSFLIATALFGVFSLLAITSTEPWMLIILRALMGIAAAGIQPASLSIITSNVREEARAQAIGLWSAGAGLAVAAGPVIGGWLLDRFSWHSVFLLNIPIVVLLLASTIIVLPRDRSTVVRSASPLSVFILMVGMLLLVFGITEWGENFDGRGAFAIIAVTGVVCCALFFFSQRKRETAVMPASMLFGRRTIGATVSLGMGTLLLMGNVFLMMLFLQLVQERSALSAGYMLLPVALSQLVFSPIAAASSKRVSPRFIAAAGFALICGAFIGYGSFNEDTPVWVILALFFLHGVGTALAVPVATSAFMTGAASQDTQYASAANTAIRQLSTALGVALFGAISSALYQRNLRPSALITELDLSSEATQSFTATLSNSRTVDPDMTQALVELANSSFSEALRETFLTGAIFAVVGLFAALLIPRQSTATSTIANHSTEA